jgi:hypothetical protein
MLLVKAAKIGNGILWIVIVFSTLMALSGNPEKVVRFNQGGKVTTLKIKEDRFNGLQPFAGIGTAAIALTTGYVLTHPLRDWRKSKEDEIKLKSNSETA